MALRGDFARQLAGARRHPADGAVFLRRRRRGVPCQGAHRRRHRAQHGERQQPCPPRARGRRRHGDHRRIHDQVGHPARGRGLVQHHRGISGPVGRCHLYPDPGGRRGDAAVLHRAPVARASTAGFVHLPRPAADRLDERLTMDALILLFAFLIFMFLGIPVAYAMGLATIVTALWIDIPLEAIMLKISDGMDDFALLTIPFFVLAGAIMSEGGVARRLVDLAKVFVGFIRGGLALVNVLASTLFGCLSGSSVADTASIGSVMIPEMVKNGYSKVFATNVTICGSVQAILVPPSHNSIIYSIATGGTVSIAALFMAGVFPGLLFGACLVGLVLITARRRNFPRSEKVPIREALRIALDAVWGLLTIVIILGGILSGAFTPVESGAVACVYGLFCTMVIYREYKWRDLPKLVHRVTKTVAMVMMVIGFAAGFCYLMAIMQIPAKATALFLSMTSNKYVMLMLINILLLLLGTFMDMAPMILICTPIMLPIVKAMGVDPVHFGMIMLLNLGIGLITPPVGPTLFVGCAIGKVTMEEVSRELWPFYGAMCAALLIVTYFPGLSLWLPRVLGY